MRLGTKLVLAGAVIMCGAVYMAATGAAVGEHAGLKGAVIGALGLLIAAAGGARMARGE